MKVNSVRLIFLLLISIFTINCSWGSENRINDIDSIHPILYLYVDQMPSFDGGNKNLDDYIYKNIKWPPEFDGNGTVLISFIVTKDGNISHAKIEKSLVSSCDLEALRLINSMPKWVAGKQNGKTVDVMLYLPIKFSLR